MTILVIHHLVVLMLNAVTAYVHVWLYIKVIHTLDVDQNVF